MNTRHHLDDSTLLSYAAGALLPALEVVASCHISACERCADRVRDAEVLGGQLLGSTQLGSTELGSAPRGSNRAAIHAPAATTSGADALLARAMAEEAADDAEAELHDQTPCNERTPAVLRRWLGDDYDALEWNSMTPGIHQVKIELGEGNLRMFRIAPGACMPIHSHHGSELTMVLRGSYSDEIGRFCAGDVADLDPDIEHQPIADRDQDCICIIATDAPLKFRGILPRLFQPFVGL